MPYIDLFSPLGVFRGIGGDNTIVFVEEITGKRVSFQKNGKTVLSTTWDLKERMLEMGKDKFEIISFNPLEQELKLKDENGKEQLLIQVGNIDLAFKP